MQLIPGLEVDVAANQHDFGLVQNSLSHCSTPAVLQLFIT